MEIPALRQACTPTESGSRRAPSSSETWSGSLKEWNYYIRHSAILLQALILHISYFEIVPTVQPKSIFKNECTMVLNHIHYTNCNTGISIMFSTGGQPVFAGGKNYLNWTSIIRKIFPLNGHSSQVGKIIFMTGKTIKHI